MRDRRSDYDITNTVQVCDTDAVCAAVSELYLDLYPKADISPLKTGFTEFGQMFRGEHQEYHGCETTYHDLQHSMDVTLAMARLIHGYERSPKRKPELGPRRAIVGLLTAIFHDIGYIRSIDDQAHKDGAEYTLTHVGRSGDFLELFLSRVGFTDAAKYASTIVHFTGYEIPLDQIHVDDEGYMMVGHLLGTADMLAQMADRCYLEKCRDRLYDEFFKGGVAQQVQEDGSINVNYSSPQNLLEKTPNFVRMTLNNRLGKSFCNAKKYMAAFFGGNSPYLEYIEKSMHHLDNVIYHNSWDLLRRKPECYNINYYQSGGSN